MNSTDGTPSLPPPLVLCVAGFGRSGSSALINAISDQAGGIGVTTTEGLSESALFSRRHMPIRLLTASRIPVVHVKDMASLMTGGRIPASTRGTGRVLFRHSRGARSRNKNEQNFEGLTVDEVLACVRASWGGSCWRTAGRAAQDYERTVELTICRLSQNTKTNIIVLNNDPSAAAILAVPSFAFSIVVHWTFSDMLQHRAFFDGRRTMQETSEFVQASAAEYSATWRQLTLHNQSVWLVIDYGQFLDSAEYRQSIAYQVWGGHYQDAREARFSLEEARHRRRSAGVRLLSSEKRLIADVEADFLARDAPWHPRVA